jgi:hypothetical protein
LDLDEQKMPRDVTMQWNSTYDMLEFTVKFQLAIDDITGDKAANLCRYELDDDEWRIAVQLQNTLKVREYPFSEISSHPLFSSWR